MKNYLTLVMLLFCVVSYSQDNWEAKEGDELSLEKSLDAKNGKYALQIKTLGTSFHQIDQVPNFNVCAGANFEASLEYKDLGSINFYMVFMFYDDNDNKIGKTIKGDQKTENCNSNEWKSLTFSEIVPDGATNAKLRLKFSKDDDATELINQIILVDNAQFNQSGNNLLQNGDFELWDNSTDINEDNVLDSEVKIISQNNNLQIISTKKIKKIEIFDLGGKLLKRVDNCKKENKISLNELPQALYIAKIKLNNNQIVSRKFLN